MKNLFFFYALLWASSSSAQELQFQLLLKDKISIRAIQVWNKKVYYTGTNAKFGYVALKDTLEKKQIRLSEEDLQFRTLAQDNTHFYAINIGSPAHFYEIEKKSLTAKMVYKDLSEHAFYDALHFHQQKFYTFSDPEKDLSLKFSSFSFSGNTLAWNRLSHLKLKEGEAAFAASNSNIASSSQYVWLATGGKFSRIFRLHLKTNNIEVFDTPFVQGSASQGIYSIDFYNDKLGIAVGGDYTQQTGNVNNIATTLDGGKTWQIQASGKNWGYKTCVKFRPKSKGKDLIAVGDQNIEFSNDYGKTWTRVSNEKNLYVCEWIDENTLIFAGKDKILKASISDILKK